MLTSFKINEASALSNQIEPSHLETINWICEWQESPRPVKTVNYLTHSVPYDDIDVGAERTINVLRSVDINEVTKMMVHIDTCNNKKYWNAQCPIRY